MEIIRRSARLLPLAGTWFQNPGISLSANPLGNKLLSLQ